MLTGQGLILLHLARGICELPDLESNHASSLVKVKLGVKFGVLFLIVEIVCV